VAAGRASVPQRVPGVDGGRLGSRGEEDHGLGLLPDAVTPQRKKVRELTGQNWVPVLVTDDGEVIQ
jgi:hypothetical protein